MHTLLSSRLYNRIGLVRKSFYISMAPMNIEPNDVLLPLPIYDWDIDNLIKRTIIKVQACEVTLKILEAGRGI